jgi:hypothetical protein
MMRVMIMGLAIGLTAALTMPSPADADGKRQYSSSGKASKGPAVRGYVVRQGGGYSYIAEDVINTYGNSRTRYGSNNFYRDPMLDRQSQFGPFDNGFFFDSGITARGGDSPYQN